MRFRGIFRSGVLRKLEEWIDEAIGLVSLARFARVLRRDVDVVCNAIDLPWSNGQAEGQINHLKRLNVRCMAEQALNFLKHGSCRAKSPISTQIEEDPD
jgi:transposase